MKKIISSSKAPKAVGPYSQAIIANGLIFVSGQLPINPESGKMPKNIVEQAKQSLNNIKAILNEAGTDLNKVIKVLIFMTDLNDFAAVNELYVAYFAADFPARSTVGVAALPLGAAIEIEVIALV